MSCTAAATGFAIGEASRRPSTTQAMTASAKPTVAGSSRSPSSGTDSSSDRKGWTSCTWLTRSAPPQARPRYQAKKPIHIEKSET